MKKPLFVAIFQLLAFYVTAQCHKSISICTTSVSIVMTDGTLYAWGGNSGGQLGDGTTQRKLVPTKIGTDANWSYFAVGESRSLGIKNDGTLWHAGYLKTGVTNLVPKQLGKDTDWKRTDTPWLAIKTNGTLWHFDETSENFMKQVGMDTDWEMATSHIGPTLAIKSNGTLWTVDLATGQATQLGNSDKWVSVQLFYDFFYGLQSDGTAWGMRSAGIKQIGTDRDWKHVYDGMGVKENGTLWNLDNYALKATRAVLDSNWIESYNNLYITMAIKDNGDIYTWGINTNDGILGNGTTTVNHSQPTKILAPCVVTDVSDEENTSDEVYPVPATDVLYIRSSPDVVVLTDIYGKATTLEGNGAYATGGLSKGLYILSYINGSEKKSHKIEIR